MSTASKQQPLTAARGRSPHNFAQPVQDWEASIFDQAEYLSVIFLRQRDRVHHRFQSMRSAVSFAQSNLSEGACIYAVTPSGRSTILDREKWAEWIQRQEQTPEPRGDAKFYVGTGVRGTQVGPTKRKQGQSR